MVYGKYLLPNNRLRLKVAFLLQAVVLWLLFSISIKGPQLQKEKCLCFLFMEGNVKTGLVPGVEAVAYQNLLQRSVI